MTPENTKTVMWTAGIVVGLVILAAIVLFLTGTASDQVVIEPTAWWRAPVS